MRRPLPLWKAEAMKRFRFTYLAALFSAAAIGAPVGPRLDRCSAAMGTCKSQGDTGVLNQDTGAMHEPCRFSHFNFDDPIVYPGDAGKSHLHLYFGNVDASASTTPANVTKAAAST